MLDFCGQHNITCQIEKISIDYINTAMVGVDARGHGLHSLPPSACVSLRLLLVFHPGKPTRQQADCVNRVLVHCRSAWSVEMWRTAL